MFYRIKEYIVYIKSTLWNIALKKINGIHQLLRKAVSTYDFFLQRCWEHKNFFFQANISHGEMVAILRRMGFQGFTEYALWQKKGGFNRTFLPTSRADFLQALSTDYSDAQTQIIKMADRILKGHFQLLGSDLTDMRRFSFSPGYKLNWDYDLISGDTFKRIFDFRRWHTPATRKGTPDIKGCWELGRMQHFATLGQAYWITLNEKYARCYARTISDFIKKNPVGIGVQWACPMDVSLRVVSWIIGLHFCQGSKHLSLSWWKNFLKSLVQHGRFIAVNLEFGTLNGDIVTSNHYLSNVFGLYWLAMAFPGLDNGCVWRGLAERGLEHEMQYQMHPDGGNFESSIPYHILVSEMFLSAYALSITSGHPFSTEYKNKLFKALCLLKAVRLPDGRIPQIGDADSGRAHILSNYPYLKPDNADYLLAAASKVLHCPELANSIDPAARIEKLFWEIPLQEKLNFPHASSYLFENSRIAVLKQGNSCVIFSNTPPGTKGFSNHKHNDHLALEWVYQAFPILVDAGSYTYTRNPMLRNQFRSTATHNTVKINDEEQNRFNPEWLFRMENDCTGTINIMTEEDKQIVHGSHTGYERLTNPVIHTRQAILNKQGLLHIQDHFTGDGDYDLEWNFLLYPGCEAILEKNKIVILTPTNKLFLRTSVFLNWSKKNAWYSPGYGLKEKTEKITARIRKKLIESSVEFIFETL